MRKFFWLLSIVVLLSSCGWGQGACIAGQVLTSRVGFNNLAALVPSATIAVSPGPIYTDQTLTTTTTNPVTADAYGNYQICAAPSVQTLTISGGGMQTLVVKQTFAVQPSSNVTWTGTNSFTTLNANTANALASTPTLCSAGQAPLGILATGNATGCTTYASIANDLGGTSALPQVISTHLSVPLPVAQGGTAVNNFAFSGNTHTACTTTGTLTNGDLVSFDVNGNCIDSGKKASASGEMAQSTLLSGCGATCTFTYPTAYSSTPRCFCTGVGGSCNIASVSTTACTINTTVASNDVLVTGAP